jgi:hypothetical protein
MQLELAFLDRPTPPTPLSGGWERIDPHARAAALEILSRLIARMLAATPAGETGDE